MRLPYLNLLLHSCDQFFGYADVYKRQPLLLLSAGLELRLEESRRAFPVIEGLSGAL